MLPSKRTLAAIRVLHSFRPPPVFYILIRPCRSFRLKSASPSKQEHARLEVENAEDDLVQKTEVAITLMKAVLDNVRDDLREFFKFNIKLPTVARTR